jgi:hypothetical protein
VHPLAVIPSQRCAQLPVPPVHAARGETGAPRTVLQVPSEPVTLQAWH